MLGMSATTGKAIDGDEHLRQSIADIILTPLGSRVLRRDYGSLLTELLDAPANKTTALRVYAAVATALRRWEPRLTLKRVQLVAGNRAGAFALQLEGQRTDTPAPNAFVRLSIPLRTPATA